MLTSKKCYVYGFRNIENGMMNIGYKSPKTDRPDYISSISNPQFWEDYYKGKVEKSLLFEGNAFQDDLAQTIEWFGLDYGMSWNKNKFYNKSNNAHCVDESLLAVEHKQLVVDWIEGRSNGIVPADRFTQDKATVTMIHDAIKSGHYKVVLECVKVVHGYERNQIRVEQIDVNHVRKIKSRFDQNPKDAWEWLLKDPVVVVVENIVAVVGSLLCALHILWTTRDKLDRVLAAKKHLHQRRQHGRHGVPDFHRHNLRATLFLVTKWIATVILSTASADRG